MQALVGRCIIGEDSAGGAGAWIGRITEAIQGEDGWTFSVSRENDGEEEMSFVYSLAFIKSTLVNSSKEAAAVTRRLNHAVNFEIVEETLRYHAETNSHRHICLA